MANWSDPRPNASAFQTAGTTRSEAYDAGLRRYMLSVYNYMASAVLLTGIVALGFVASGAAATVFGGPGILKWVITLAPLGFVFGMSFGQARMSNSTLQMMFWGFAVAMGLALDDLPGLQPDRDRRVVLRDGSGVRWPEPLRLHHQA